MAPTAGLGLLESRSNRLARALQRLRASGCISVVCCPDHEFDAQVAAAAVLKIGALPQAIDPSDLDAGGPLERSHVVLACAEGARAWRGAGLLGVVITDAPYELWWKALEARESSGPLLTTR